MRKNIQSEEIFLSPEICAKKFCGSKKKTEIFLMFLAQIL